MLDLGIMQQNTAAQLSNARLDHDMPPYILDRSSRRGCVALIVVEESHTLVQSRVVIAYDLG